jgi:hypothetical protein
MGARCLFREKWRLASPAVAAKDDPLDLAARSDDPDAQENALSPIPDQKKP